MAINENVRGWLGSIAAAAPPARLWVLSSMRRPILTFRPGQVAYPDQRGSGLRHFPADMHLAAWLDAMGIAWDAITDHDIEAEGVGLLARYKTVLTGSHPEYHSLGTLDALRDYTATGGRLVYLGGNGFYWRVAVSAEVPDVLELRRHACLGRR